MTTPRKRATALDKAKLRVDELEDRNATLQSAWEHERAAVRRLEARCSFLYEMAITFAEESARVRLAGSNGPLDGSVPRVQSNAGVLEPVGYVAPSTERRLRRT